MTTSHLDLDERRALGEKTRSDTPLSAHAQLDPSADRADPVDLLNEQSVNREADLVPVRHGRMMVSPFTFYRGAARVMATDLARTPTTGLDVQLCGDAHLSNFGGFASPERQLLFGLNDFDETLPGPFEYDVKRMSASFTIAANNNGFTPAAARAVTAESAKAYRQAMAGFAAMRTLDIWYAHMSEEKLRDIMDTIAARSSNGSGKGKADKKSQSKKPSKDDTASLAKILKTLDKTMRKAHTRDSVHALPRFAELSDGKHRIVSQPPVVTPLRDLGSVMGLSEEAARSAVESQFEAYQTSLGASQRKLLERFTIVDMARKVVGVGSVGTRAYMVLLEGRDGDDPLFLQVKEATASVLEEQLPKSRFHTPGQRVVEGQRLMQPVSDIFLGWTKGLEENRFYYWRQLRDMKASALVEAMEPTALKLYARMCGWALAHAHARSGDPVAIAEYLGDDDTFDEALADFSTKYAAQNQLDYEAFVEAVRSGRIEAIQGV